MRKLFLLGGTVLLVSVLYAQQKDEHPNNPVTQGKVTLPPALPPILQKLEQQLAPLVPKIFKPIPKPLPKPVVLIPKMAPLALRGRWSYLDIRPLVRFVLSPLPIPIGLVSRYGLTGITIRPFAIPRQIKSGVTPSAEATTFISLVMIPCFA